MSALVLLEEESLTVWLSACWASPVRSLFLWTSGLISEPPECKACRMERDHLCLNVLYYRKLQKCSWKCDWRWVVSSKMSTWEHYEVVDFINTHSSGFYENEMSVFLVLIIMSRDYFLVLIITLIKVYKNVSYNVLLTLFSTKI